mmetsp:Transcript_1413/g.1923  ORF Transcript_1413/g.1923 Transcript_1413/m.1923 type:complete len:176 (-) Transcript_1413:334-861(-)|eukprot:CAMPEP_0198146938 /NCGR_PEP_ID=MMETSP1443-20131203/32348_1 /TAXON_ID=186043 /ORGANISM="Entomoneis sp., Strain CCMP2396" /LENGTH=175 /DNA_ID=CAMNT_0043811053 /DNA_START=294 /DNA_END=821 /DNA_ORIENTATION=-
MSEQGESIKEHLTKKYGSSAAASFNDPNSNLRVMGRKVGIEFNDNRLMVNTKRAHALVEHLKTKGENESANEFMVDLYKSYFEHGQDINDETLLKEKVLKFGVVEQEASFALSDHNLMEITKKDRQVKSSYGVNGVPFYMIHPNNGGPPVAFSGAYPPEIIGEQLEVAAAAAAAK